MHLHNQIRMFYFGNIPMIGNFDTGYAIGLTENGAELSRRLLAGEIGLDEIEKEDCELAAALKEGLFFQEQPNSGGLSLAYLHVTNRCNLKCAGCYSLDESRNVLGDASTDQMKEAIRKLAQGGVETLVISGGEPFLRDDLPVLVSYAKESDIGFVTVSTNGTCLKTSALIEMAPAVDRIAVSFDVCSAEDHPYIRGEQRFAKLIDAVEIIRDAGITPHITATIHAKNYRDLAKYKQLAALHNVSLNFSLLSCPFDCADNDLLPSDDDLRQLAALMMSLESTPSDLGEPFGLDLTVGMSCGLGAKEISVGANGQVYPCHMLHRKEFVLGNIFDESLAHILSGRAAKSFAQIGVEDIEGCNSCTHKYLCAGGCRARSLFRYGDLIHRDGYCELMNTYYGALLSLLETKSETAASA